MLIAKIKKLDGTLLDHGKFESQEAALAWFQPFIDKGVYGQKHIPARQEQIIIKAEELDEQGQVISPAEYQVVNHEEILADFEIEYQDIALQTAQELLNQKWEQFRSDRDKKLAETDYTQLADAPYSSEEKLQYRNYRAYLRNAPNLYNDTTILDAVVRSFEEFKLGII